MESKTKTLWSAVPITQHHALTPSFWLKQGCSRIILSYRALQVRFMRRQVDPVINWILACRYKKILQA